MKSLRNLQIPQKLETTAETMEKTWQKRLQNPDQSCKCGKPLWGASFTAKASSTCNRNFSSNTALNVQQGPLKIKKSKWIGWVLNGPWACRISSCISWRISWCRECKLFWVVLDIPKPWSPLTCKCFAASLRLSSTYFHFPSWGSWASWGSWVSMRLWCWLRRCTDVWCNLHPQRLMGWSVCWSSTHWRCENVLD